MVVVVVVVKWASGRGYCLLVEEGRDEYRQRKSRKNRTLFAVQFRLTDCDRDREEMNGR